MENLDFHKYQIKFPEGGRVAAPGAPATFQKVVERVKPPLSALPSKWYDSNFQYEILKRQSDVLLIKLSTSLTSSQLDAGHRPEVFYITAQVQKDELLNRETCTPILPDSSKGSKYRDLQAIEQKFAQWVADVESAREGRQRRAEAVKRANSLNNRWMAQIEHFRKMQDELVQELKQLNSECEIMDFSDKRVKQILTELHLISEWLHHSKPKIY